MMSARQRELYWKQFGLPGVYKAMTGKELRKKNEDEHSY